MEPETKRQLILLTGVPGSGKTQYAKHLRDDYGFFFVETDNDLQFMGKLVRASVSDAKFVERLVEEYGRVVVEWGFRPDLYLPNVIALKEQGARLVWFAGDDAVALPAYQERHKSDPVALHAREIQMRRIKDAGLPTPGLFQVVHATRGNGFVPYNELDQMILR